MNKILQNLLRKKSLKRISGVKHEIFKKLVRKLQPAWNRAQKRKRVSGRPYEIGGLQEHLLLLLIYYRTYATYLVLSQLFQVDEATICRAIRRISPLAQRLLQIKPERLFQSDELKLMIVDATEQRIERPKNQRDYYSVEKHAHTIKTEIVTDPSGKILRVSKPYEGRVHDFEIRKKEGALPAIPILADSGYQGLQNEHTAAVILPQKRSKNRPLRDSDRTRNTRLARCRIVIEHIFAHLKKWNILAARFRGHLATYSAVFQSIAGLHNFVLAK